MPSCQVPQLVWWTVGDLIGRFLYLLAPWFLEVGGCGWRMGSCQDENGNGLQLGWARICWFNVESHSISFLEWCPWGPWATGLWPTGDFGLRGDPQCHAAWQHGDEKGWLDELQAAERHLRRATPKSGTLCYTKMAGWKIQTFLVKKEDFDEFPLLYMSSFLCALCRTAVQFSQNPSKFMCNTGSHEAPKIHLHRFEFESGVWTYLEFQLSWKLLLFCPWFNETSLNPGRFNLPIMIVASRFAVKEQQKSLKSSSVKLAARDVAPRTNGNMQMFNHSRRCNVQEKYWGWSSPLSILI